MRSVVAAILTTVVTVLMATVIAACGGDDDASKPSPTIAPPLPSAAPTQRAIPPTPDPTLNARRTGIADVDAVIDAVLSRGGEHLLALAEYQPVACSGPTPGSLGTLLCDEGEVDGTLVEVVPWSSCEGGYLRRDAGLPEREGLLDPAVMLHAVARVGSDYDVFFSSGPGPDERRYGILVSVSRGHITGVNFGCSQPIGEWTGRYDSASFVLPPP